MKPLGIYYDIPESHRLQKPLHKSAQPLECGSSVPLW